jgi:RHS repeat-associated protein
VFVATTSDPTRSDDPATGKGQVLWSSVRDEVLAVDDVPSGAPTLRTRYSYDRLGQLVRVVDSAGNATSHSYDGLGRRLSTRTPDAGLREQVWDPAGNLVAEVTPNQRTAGTRIAYDYDVDRLTKIDYPTGTPDVTYRYGGQGADGNGAGRVVALEDGAREQSLAYDALGNVAVETTTMKAQNLNADTRAKLTYRTAFEHDSFGRLAELTYPDGEVLRHEYDSGGMLSGLQGTKDCTELGRLTAAVAASATTITMTEVASSAPAVPFTIRIGREQLRVTERTATADPAVFTYTVERGVNGTLEVPTAAAHSAGAKATSDVAVDCDYRYLDRQEYDQFLSRRLRDTGNGVRSEWAFDYLGRLETLTTETPERVVQAMTWGYDKADNVVSMDNEVPATVPSLYVGPSSQDFAYDPYYRLKSATGQADLGLGKVRTFTQAMTYDAHGNVTSKKQTDVIGNATGQGPKPLVQAPTTYSFGMQYGGGGPHQLRKNGSRTYTHDANGNLTGFTDSVTKEKRVVTWDAEDRITKIADGKDSTDYRYDADGRRAVERGPDGETLFVNRYYTVRNGSVPWKQVWAGDDRLGSKRSFDGAFEHQQYFFAKDLQGSTNVVTDDIGKVFEHWEYFPGGEPWIREDSNVHRTPHLYAGGYLDEVRDLVNLGERWYEPREGLFYSPDAALHRDPMAAVDDPALLPAYTYAESSPLRLVDPGGAAPSAAGIALQAAGIASRANPWPRRWPRR